MAKIETTGGEYRVFTADETGAPELHEAGKWHFEPGDYDGGEVFSQGYDTEAEAVAAAQDWANRA